MVPFITHTNILKLKIFIKLVVICLLLLIIIIILILLYFIYSKAVYAKIVRLQDQENGSVPHRIKQ